VKYGGIQLGNITAEQTIVGMWQQVISPLVGSVSLDGMHVIRSLSHKCNGYNEFRERIMKSNYAMI